MFHVERMSKRDLRRRAREYGVPVKWHTSETELRLSVMRGDAYPPTRGGLEQAVRDLVPHVKRVQVVEDRRHHRAVAWITPRWYARLTFGILPWLIRRRARRVIDVYRPAFVAVGVSTRSGR